MNTIFSALKKLWSQADELLRVYALGIQRECLHVSGFTGYVSKKSLTNADVLEEIFPENLNVFVEAFRRLKNVVNSCYGSFLQHDSATKIESFEVLSEVEHPNHAENPCRDFSHQSSDLLLEWQ